jgi:hypothetical protein
MSQSNGSRHCSESSSGPAPAHKKSKTSVPRSQASKDVNRKKKPQKRNEPVGNLEAYVKTFDASAEGATPIIKLLDLLLKIS